MFGPLDIIVINVKRYESGLKRGVVSHDYCSMIELQRYIIPKGNEQLLFFSLLLSSRYGIHALLTICSGFPSHFHKHVCVG